jgi:DNA-binding MarR family transcriptional regulator
VQRIVDELAEDGVVEFAPNPHHRRAKLLLFTEHGLRLHRAAVDRRVPWVNGLADALREQDITVTRHLVHTLLERLDPRSTSVGTTSDR